MSNFRAVSELHTDQAEKSYSALGFQGSIDATKKFAHLKPETVNAICTRTAEALGIKPVQSAGRHLIKHADSHLKSEPEANPSELLERAYSEILQFPEDIADAYKTEPKDYKALYEASQRALEATRAEVQMRDGEIAELRTALAEAMDTDTELNTEAEAIAAG